MRIRLRHYLGKGVLRLDNSAVLEEIFCEQEKVHLCFKTGEFSGIVELSSDETVALLDKLQRTKKIIKKMTSGTQGSFKF